MNQNQNNPDFLKNKAGADEASFEDFLHTVNTVGMNEGDSRQSAPGQAQPGAPTPGYPSPDLPPMPNLGGEMSDIGGLPPMPDLPAMPGMPDFSAISGAPTMPGTPNFPDLPETPTFPDFPGVPDFGGMPGTPPMPEAPDFSAMTGAPSIPGLPEIPNFPDMPSMPDDMGMSGMSGLSALPDNMSFDTEEPDDLPDSVLAQMGVESLAAHPADQAVADLGGLELAGLDSQTDVDLGAADDEAAQMLGISTGLDDLSYAGVSYDNLGAGDEEATDQEWPEIPAVQTAEIALPRDLAAAVHAAEDEAAGKHTEPAKEKTKAAESRYKVNRKASKNKERFALDFGTTPDVDKKFRRSHVPAKDQLQENLDEDQKEDFFEAPHGMATTDTSVLEPEDQPAAGDHDLAETRDLETSAEETTQDTSEEMGVSEESQEREESPSSETEELEVETETETADLDLTSEEGTEAPEEPVGEEAEALLEAPVEEEAEALPEAPVEEGPEALPESFVEEEPEALVEVEEEAVEEAGDESEEESLEKAPNQETEELSEDTSEVSVLEEEPKAEEEALETKAEDLTVEASEELEEETPEASEESFEEPEKAEESEPSGESEPSEEMEAPETSDLSGEEAEAAKESFVEGSEAESVGDETKSSEELETAPTEETEVEAELISEVGSEDEAKPTAEELEEGTFDEVNFDDLQGDMLTQAVEGITFEEDNEGGSLATPSPKEEKPAEGVSLPAFPDFLAGSDVLTGDEAEETEKTSSREAAQADDQSDSLFAGANTPWSSDQATKAASTEFIPEMPEDFDLEDGLFAGTIDQVAHKPEGEPKTSVFDPMAFIPEAGLPSSLPDEMTQGELGTLANLEALADSANEGEQLTRPTDLPEGEATAFSDEDLAAAMDSYLDGANMPKELNLPDIEFAMPDLPEEGAETTAEEPGEKADEEDDFDLSAFTGEHTDAEGAREGAYDEEEPKAKISLTPEEKAEEERKALEHNYEESAQSLHQSLSSPESATYARLGVSTAKKAIKKALRNTDKGIFPGAFAIIQEDIAGDPDYCYAMHADGAGNKSSLSYLQYKNTGNIKAFRGVAEDATVMNLDDLMCVGATGPFYLSNTISRNAQRIPSAAVGEIIDSYQSFFEKMGKYGVEIKSCGGETADMGDTIMTLAIDAIASVRMKREDVIDCSRIKPGLVIVGFSSSGQTIYEEKPNSGIGSNGLTAAKHALLNKSYAQLYPETYSVGDNYDDVYTGNFTMSSPLPGTSTTIGEAILSPTRTYAPVLVKIFEEHRKDIYGIVHLTGGGLCKPLSFSKGIKYINDNLFRRPPIFEQIALTQKFLDQEMYKIFNLGQRLEIFVEEDIAPKIIEIAESFKLDAQVIGRTEANEDPETNQLLIKDLGCEYYFFSNN